MLMSRFDRFYVDLCNKLWHCFISNFFSHRQDVGQLRELKLNPHWNETHSYYEGKDLSPPLVIPCSGIVKMSGNPSSYLRNHGRRVLVPLRTGRSRHGCMHGCVCSWEPCGGCGWLGRSPTPQYTHTCTCTQDQRVFRSNRGERWPR